jgi:D-amino-acid dehydrogenase
VIGPSANVINVFYGFGHGHMGLTWGPSTGRLLAAMMAQKPINLDLAPYSIDRF